MFPCSPQINKFVPLFPNSKYLNAFQRPLFINFYCFLTPCSLLKAAYPHVPRNILVGLRKVRRHMSRTYIGGYSAGAGSSLARVIFERSHVLLVGKKCSRNSTCRDDSFYVVCDACCMTVLLSHTHGNKLFSLN